MDNQPNKKKIGSEEWLELRLQIAKGHVQMAILNAAALAYHKMGNDELACEQCRLHDEIMPPIGEALIKLTLFTK